MPWTCPACEEVLDEEYEDLDDVLCNGAADYAGLTDRFICRECWDDDLGDHRSTLIIFDPAHDTPTKLIFGDEVAVDHEWLEDATSVLRDLGITERRYVHTGGWRGYHDTTPTPRSS